MKTTRLALLIATVFALPLSAQLNTKHNRIRSGDVIVKQQVEFKNPGEAGANRIWDFSKLKTINDEYTLVYSPAPLLNDSTYIMGTMKFDKEAVTNDELIIGIEHNTMYYYQIKDNALWQLGHENPSVRLNYVTPILAIQYPLNYGQSSTEIYNSKGLYSATVDIRTNGTVTTTADAYGKIVLPSGDTLSPILRTKTIQTIYDLMIDGTVKSPGKLLETYRWYSKGYRYPVFETVRNINTADNSVIFSTAFFFPPQEHLYLETDLDNKSLLDKLWTVDGQVLKVQTENVVEKDIIEAEDKSYKIYPNPVKSILTIEYTVEKNTPLVIQLYSIDGKLIKTINKEEQKEGTHKEKIDCSHLPQGSYLLKIIANNNTANEKIIKL